MKLRFLAALVSLVFLAGCAAQPPAPPVLRTLRAAVPPDVVHLVVAGHTREGLVRLGAGGAAHQGSGLAQSWTASIDDRTWLFLLRDAVGAAAVIAAWSSVPDGPIRALAAQGDRVVQAELAMAMPGLPHLLALPAYAVGPGPFRLAEAAEGRLVLEKNPDYWNAAVVTLDRLEIHALPPAEAAQRLRQGELDSGWVPPGFPGARKVEMAGAVILQFADALGAAARRSIALATDRAELAGEHTPAAGAYDPVRARQQWSGSVIHLEGEGALAARIADMWRLHLGADVQLVQRGGNVRLVAWQAPYPGADPPPGEPLFYLVRHVFDAPGVGGVVRSPAGLPDDFTRATVNR